MMKMSEIRAAIQAGQGAAKINELQQIQRNEAERQAKRSGMIQAGLGSGLSGLQSKAYGAGLSDTSPGEGRAATGFAQAQAQRAESREEFGGTQQARPGDYLEVPTGKGKGGEIETDIVEDPYMKAERESILGAEKGRVGKLYDKMTSAEIAMSSLDPKIGYAMRKAAPAYQELKDQAKQSFGMNLDFESGGLEYWKSKAVKKWFDTMRQTPQMDAISRLRPEIGFEVMRQIGPFRSAQAGLVFTETLPDFSGHIPTDISRAVTTMTKSYLGALSNKALAMEAVGREFTPDEQERMGRQYEANMIRQLNKTYRQTGITTKFYGAGESLEDVAKYSKFSPKEKEIIDSFEEKYPDRSRDELIVSMIDEGLI